MKNSNMEIKVSTIPMGAWDIDGRWYPNLNLEMTIAEQIEHNIKGGYARTWKLPVQLTYIINER